MRYGLGCAGRGHRMVVWRMVDIEQLVVGGRKHDEDRLQDIGNMVEVVVCIVAHRVAHCADEVPQRHLLTKTCLHGHTPRAYTAIHPVPTRPYTP